MSAPKVAALSAHDFAELFEAIGPSAMARQFNCHVRNVYQVRRVREQELGRLFKAPASSAPYAPDRAIAQPSERFIGRLEASVTDGVVVVGSDAHYWPGELTAAHQHFVRFVKEEKPDIVVANGDMLDGATISRHASIGWESRPPLVAEIEECKERLGELEDASKNSELVWTLGNHDLRFETRLAAVAPEYARIHGVHLKDHFPRWKPCWSLMINDTCIIKHRMRNGVHATWNNTLHAGLTIVTGHLHSLQIKPKSDYNGTRWGVDCGTLADPRGPQFADYTEDGPKDWRMGFAVLTFRAGRLLWPELYYVRDDGIGEWRGQEIEL